MCEQNSKVQMEAMHDVLPPDEELQDDDREVVMKAPNYLISWRGTLVQSTWGVQPESKFMLAKGHPGTSSRKRIGYGGDPSPTQILERRSMFLPVCVRQSSTPGDAGKALGLTRVFWGCMSHN